jgi:HPt (histidine-containing phosphotransfer) domain-containing protein
MQDETDKAAFRRTAELQSQMDRIGGRFLERALVDIDAMEKALDDLKGGNPAAAANLELFAHRIHGSSAIFGYTGLSEAAGRLESLLASWAASGATVSVGEVSTHLAHLRAAAQAARAGSAG